MYTMRLILQRTEDAFATSMEKLILPGKYHWVEANLLNLIIKEGMSEVEREMTTSRDSQRRRRKRSLSKPLTAVSYKLS